jgi:hypothetical protein
VKLVIDATTFDSGNSHCGHVVLGTALNTAQYQTITFESTHLENVQIDVPGKMGHAVVVGARDNPCDSRSSGCFAEFGWYA